MLDDEEEFIRQKKLLEPMLVSEAWKEYERILNAQIANHMAQLMSSANPTLDGLSQVMSGEYRKGAVFGIQRAVATPYDIIRSANEIIENRHVTKELLSNALETQPATQAQCRRRRKLPPRAQQGHRPWRGRITQQELLLLRSIMTSCPEKPSQ